MKKSAVVSAQENGDAWDPQEHFATVLEEAKRRHERRTKQEEEEEETAAAAYSSPSSIKQATVVGRSEEEEKKKNKINNKKKSRWKDTLFFWRKSEEKIKPKHFLLTPNRESPHKNTSFGHVSSNSTGRRAVSGPIHAGGEQVCHHLTRWNSYRASNASRDAEIKISYTLLDQQNQPRKMDGAFGPIYLVT